MSAKPLRPRFQYFVHSARGATNPTGCAKTAQRLRGNSTSTRAEFLTEFRHRRTRQRRGPVPEYDEVRARMLRRLVSDTARIRCGVVRAQCGALDQRVPAVADLACGDAVDGIDWLIKRSAASSVASLFCLVPAVTAVMACVLLASGSMGSRSRACLSAPPRCFWSTGARKPDEASSPKTQVPKQKPPDFHPEALSRGAVRA
jgi:hypothetical protein